MPIEIVTAIIAAAATLITSLIKASLDKKKMILDFENKEQQRISALIEKLEEKENKRAAEDEKWKDECLKAINDLKYSIEKTNLQLANVEERLSERIDALSERVHKHNGFGERIPKLEAEVEMLKQNL